MSSRQHVCLIISEGRLHKKRRPSTVSMSQSGIVCPQHQGAEKLEILPFAAVVVAVSVSSLCVLLRILFTLELACWVWQSKYCKQQFKFKGVFLRSRSEPLPRFALTTGPRQQGASETEVLVAVTYEIWSQTNA